MIPLGLEPKAYCLEGSCSIQLSYGTDLYDAILSKIGCKGSDIFGNRQILYGKSYISAVIEAVVSWCETLCGFETADVQRV